MPKFAKGSKEAKAWGEKMREARMNKNKIIGEGSTKSKVAPAPVSIIERPLEANDIGIEIPVNKRDIEQINKRSKKIMSEHEANKMIARNPNLRKRQYMSGRGMCKCQCTICGGFLQPNEVPQRPAESLIQDPEIKIDGGMIKKDKKKLTILGTGGGSSTLRAKRRQELRVQADELSKQIENKIIEIEELKKEMDELLDYINKNPENNQTEGVKEQLRELYKRFKNKNIELVELKDLYSKILMDLYNY